MADDVVTARRIVGGQGGVIVVNGRWGEARVSLYFFVGRFTVVSAGGGGCVPRYSCVEAPRLLAGRGICYRRLHEVGCGD
jgi:hypothetical protein